MGKVKLSEVTLLSHDGELKWEQSDEELRLVVSAIAVCEFAYLLRWISKKYA